MVEHHDHEITHKPSRLREPSRRVGRGIVGLTPWVQRAGCLTWTQVEKIESSFTKLLVEGRALLLGWLPVLHW